MSQQEQATVDYPGNPARDPPPTAPAEADAPTVPAAVAPAPDTPQNHPTPDQPTGEPPPPPATPRAERPHTGAPDNYVLSMIRDVISAVEQNGSEAWYVQTPADADSENGMVWQISIRGAHKNPSDSAAGLVMKDGKPLAVDQHGLTVPPAIATGAS